MFFSVLFAAALLVVVAVMGYGVCVGGGWHYMQTAHTSGLQRRGGTLLIRMIQGTASMHRRKLSRQGTLDKP